MMRMSFKTMIVAVALIAGATADANAQGLSDLLKGLGRNDGGISSTIGNALQGIFTKTDLTLDDLVGEYESTGPAVAFKSENFLQKAGGIAGAAALETKLQPYYEQYGMIGMPLKIDKDATITLMVKRIKLNGTVIRNDGDGTFTFNIMVAGMKIGQFTAYVQKTGRDLDLMFDATKLKELISMVGKFSGSKLTASLSTLLDSYEGACMGFKMSYKGGGMDSPTTTSPGSSSSGSTTNGSSDTTSDPIGSLFELLNRRK